MPVDTFVHGHFSVSADSKLGDRIRQPLIRLKNLTPLFCCTIIYLVEHTSDKRKREESGWQEQLLYATEKAESLKNSKAHIEAVFYEWLLEDLPEEERQAFCETLDKLYRKSKRQRQAGFADVSDRIVGKEEARDER